MDRHRYPLIIGIVYGYGITPCLGYGITLYGYGKIDFNDPSPISFSWLWHYPLCLWHYPCLVYLTMAPPSMTRFHLQCGAAWLQSKLNETKVGRCPVCNAAIVLPVMVEGTHYSSRRTLQHGMSSTEEPLWGPGSTRVVLVLGTPCAWLTIVCIMGGLITLLVALTGGFSHL
jgi:hypothetical protein